MKRTNSAEQRNDLNPTIENIPLVTVVIPTYNRGKHIKHAIRSVLNQTITDWKLLIIDDASTDKTEKVVRAYRSDKRIRYIKLKTNQGVSNALKEALKLVDTKYLAQLDSDDWYEPDTLEICLQNMEKSSEKVGMVYGNALVWKDKGNGKIKKTEKLKHRQITGKYDLITYQPMFYPRFYRMEALLKAGGWTTDVPYKGRYAEDRQILLKLIERYEIKWINKTLYNLLKHDSNNSSRKNRDKYARVTKYLYKKALKDWGDDYKPIFTKKGWLRVKKLVKQQNDITK